MKPLHLEHYNGRGFDKDLHRLTYADNIKHYRLCKTISVDN